MIVFRLKGQFGNVDVHEFPCGQFQNVYHRVPAVRIVPTSESFFVSRHVLESNEVEVIPLTVTGLARALVMNAARSFAYRAYAMAMALGIVKRTTPYTPRAIAWLWSS